MDAQDRGQLLLLFADASHSNKEKINDISPKIHSNVVWHLFIDGAARNNPGPAGAGVYIVKDGVPFYQDGYYLGTQTNNQAEYIALLLGCYFLEQWKQPDEKLMIFSDSQLLVRQMQGKYRVRNSALLPRYRAAVAWMKQLDGIIKHIPREDNQHADSMANQGVDFKKQPPAAFVARMKSYEVLDR